MYYSTRSEADANLQKKRGLFYIAAQCGASSLSITVCIYQVCVMCRVQEDSIILPPSVGHTRYLLQYVLSGMCYLLSPCLASVS